MISLEVKFMKNSEHSIKQSFRNKIMKYSFIPITITIVVLITFFSLNRWNRLYNSIDYGSINNAQFINMQFTYLEHVLNNIVNDGYAQEFLKNANKNDFSEKINLLNEINEYCNKYYNSYNGEKVKIRIYHDNYNLYRSDYVRYVSELDKKVFNDIMNMDNFENMWVFTDKDTSVCSNLSTDDNVFLVFCSIDNITLRNFLNINIYYPNTGIGSQNVEIVNQAPKSKMRFTIFQPLISGQYLKISIPRSEVLRIFLPFYAIGFVAIVLLLVISSAMANNTTAKLTKKLYEFFDFVRNEKSHNNLSELQIDENDELYDVFLKVKQLINDIERKDNEKNELIKYNSSLQLAYAQLQINPHLLYNSLSVIKWNCIEKCPELVEKIDVMVEYYRLSINNLYDNYTIENELKLIEKYLQLISMIHEIDYKYIINIDSKIMHQKTIQHFFQPFIENAVLHGINGNCNGYISIDGVIKDDMIVFCITDNGNGFNVDDLKSSEYKKKKHIGIKNTCSRIKLFYGSESNVEINSTIGKGTTVTIKIPNINI